MGSRLPLLRNAKCLAGPRWLALSFLALAIVAATNEAGGEPPRSRAGTVQPQASPGGVPELKLRWSVEAKGVPDFAMAFFDLDGQSVLVVGRNKVEGVMLSARTGSLRKTLKNDDVRFFSYAPIPLDGGKLALRANGRQIVLWEPGNGKSTRLPVNLPGNSMMVDMSTNGRYVAIGHRPANPQGKSNPSLLQINDLKTGKAVLSFEWTPGKVYFSADSLRALVVDATDRFRWFKLPSGRLDGEWKFDREASGFNGQVLSMSVDGSVLLYSGMPPTKENSLHLLDGTNGNVIHEFPARTYNSRIGFLSRDGSAVVLFRTNGFGTGNTVEVLNRRGTLLARLPVPQPGVELSASWDARAAVLYDRDGRKVWVYDLPSVGSLAGARTRSGHSIAKFRAAIPGDVAQLKAEGTVHQILKAEYARKQPAERKALIHKLITLAGETTDDRAARYVMLRDARDFAVELHDPSLALQAIETLVGAFEIDPSAAKLSAFEKIVAATSTQSALKAIFEDALPSSETAESHDEYEEAMRFAQLAGTAARKGRLGQSATDDADYRLSQAKKERESYLTIRPAIEKLRAAPDDAEANTTVGKYRCFLQGRWDEGLKNLTKGTSAALRDLADIDLKAPRTGTAEVKVADAWWEYAQTAPADERWGAQARTRYWYGRAMPGLAGLDKAKAEVRLEFSAGGVEYRPGLLCELSAKPITVLKGKKARIDPVIDFSGGEFAEGTKAADLTIKWSGVIVPPVAGRYEIAATTLDPVRIRIDGKTVVDGVTGKGGKKDAKVTLGERPVPIVVEYFAPNTDRHKLTLTWVQPGTTSAETIPAENLFHSKKSEAVLGK